MCAAQTEYSRWVILIRYLHYGQLINQSLQIQMWNSCLLRCMICPLCSRMNFRSLINPSIIRNPEVATTKIVFCYYKPRKIVVGSPTFLVLDELHPIFLSGKCKSSHRKPCSSCVPFIRALVSRGLYLFSLLLRCIDHQSQVGSLTVPEWGWESCFCLPPHVCTILRPVRCTESNWARQSMNSVSDYLCI